MESNKELEKAIESKFLTPSRFALEIEKIVAEEKINYIDAIVHYCEVNELEGAPSHRPTTIWMYMLVMCRLAL